MHFSPKQAKSIAEANHRYNFWGGAVSGGKTYASTHSLIDKIKNGPKGDCMMTGYSRATLQRNVLNGMYEIMGWAPPSSKSSEDKLYGRNIYFLGANDETSMNTIKGVTLALSYCDEVNTMPKSSFKMMQSRLRVPGAQMLGTYNPEGPSHWFKKEVIDRAGDIDIINWTFLLDDNPSLDDTYKEALKKEYTGVWFKRLILGEWAVAHGLIYDSFDDDNLYEHPISNASYYICGVDYGTSNATAAVLLAVTPNRWPQIRVEQEYYYDSVVKGRQKTDDELATDLFNFVRYKPVRAIYVDPSAASLKLELQRRNLPVLNANNDVIEGIKVTSKFIAGKNIIVQKGCKTLIECMQTYSWDPKAADRGEDKPLKEREHICVVGSTLVDVNGFSARISSLYRDQKEGILVNYNMESRELEIDKFMNVTLTKKNATVVKLTLWDGTELTATPDHRVLTKKGMKMIKDLTLNDILVKSRAKIKICAKDIDGYIGYENVLFNTKIYHSKVRMIEQLKTPMDVYCLATEKNGTFVANGIVISNCDALRYCIYTAFPTGELNNPDENLTIEQIRRNVYGDTGDLLGFNTGGYY